MARCGCSGGCSCRLTEGDNVTITGDGSSDRPYVINSSGGGGGGSPPVGPARTHTFTLGEVADPASWYGSDVGVNIWGTWTPEVSGVMTMWMGPDNGDPDFPAFEFDLWRGTVANVDYPDATAASGSFSLDTSNAVWTPNRLVFAGPVVAGQAYTLILVDWSGAPVGRTTNLAGILNCLAGFGVLSIGPPPPLPLMANGLSALETVLPSGPKMRITRDYTGAQAVLTDTAISSFSEGDWSNISSGRHSHAEGDGTRATGQTAHAEGFSSQATGIGSHAEGSSIASRDWSHAEGSGTTASGIASHAEGAATIASSYYTHAEGAFTVASADSAHAEGEFSLASGFNSHAEGLQTVASGYTSHAQGINSVAWRQGEHAESSGYAGDIFTLSSQNPLQVSRLTFGGYTGVGVTDTTLKIGGVLSFPAPTNVFLSPNKLSAVKGRVIARSIDGTVRSAWAYEVVASKGAALSTPTLVAAATVTVIAADAGAATWTLGITATTDGLLFSAHGGNAGMYWAGFAEIVEV